MDAARRWGQTPLQFYGLSAGGFHEEDRTIARALILLERAKCSGGCGHYVDEAWGDREGDFEVDGSMFCWACAAAEEHQRSGKDAEPGQKFHVIERDWDDT